MVIGFNTNNLALQKPLEVRFNLLGNVNVIGNMRQYKIWKYLK